MDDARTAARPTIDRSTGKPKWQKVDDELLGEGDWLVQNDGYYDFFWQIFNQYVRVRRAFNYLLYSLEL